jgi:hypothetical protein
MRTAYVSQAALWAEGRLSAPDPLAMVASIVGPAAAPLGYQMGTAAGSIVPVYPAGLPVLMAIAIRVGGPSAAYLVVPLLGGFAVWLTYLLGVRIADARAGVVAAVLVAFTPIFMFQSLEPMSDVPATAWWLLAWVLVLSPGGAAAFGAGLSVSAALLTRPNLVPLAALLVAVAAASAPRRRRVVLLARRTDSRVRGGGGAERALVRRPAALRLRAARRVLCLEPFPSEPAAASGPWMIELDASSHPARGRRTVGRP